jgi:branched-chain amino acid transport system ATP-binding protein
VKQIAESGLTILLVEQQIHRAMQVASYAFVLENGTMVLSGNPVNCCGTSISRKSTWEYDFPLSYL